MGKVVLAWQLARADLRRRRRESALLLLVIAAAATTLTLGLILHGVSADPYQRTRAATSGPDVVVTAVPPANAQLKPADLSALQALSRAPGVKATTGPYPLTWATLDTHRLKVGAEVIGRDQTPAAIDQPRLSQGHWIRPGGAVLEASFAAALGARPGDVISLDGRAFSVVGIAVTAAIPPYPQVCTIGCALNLAQLTASNTGVVWLTRTDALSLVTAAEPVSYFLNVRLADPAGASAFARTIGGGNSALGANSWQEISAQDGKLVASEQQAFVAGSWLLTLLALASVGVLVGGRMADQKRRVGLLKAVGATPGFVAAVLLAEYLLLAVLAAAAGLVFGRLAAPLFTNTSGGFIGRAGVPKIALGTAGTVMATALGVVAIATVVPALRAARISTVRALADSSRPPRRSAWLIRLTTRLPISLLLGIRLAARHPRRMLLSTLSVAITVGGIVAVLSINIQRGRRLGSSSGLNNPWTNDLNRLLLLITVMLVLLTAINAVFITWSTVLDSRRPSALARALGATPQQVVAAVSSAQVIPSLAGAILGVPAGIALVAAAQHGGTLTYLPAWQAIVIVPICVLAVIAITAVPARLAAREPIAATLRAEPA